TGPTLFNGAANAQFDLTVDHGDANNGSLTNGLHFGNGSGEGIASKRTSGGNKFGLDFYTGFQNRVSITNVGNVGIGATNPTVRLDVNGHIRATSLTQTSDARFKTNVATIQNALDAVLKLRGVNFDWKQDEPGDKNFPEGRQIGFLAQEVERVLPELVHTDK